MFILHLDDAAVSCSMLRLARLAVLLNDMFVSDGGRPAGLHNEPLRVGMHAYGHISPHDCDKCACVAWQVIQMSAHLPCSPGS